MWNEFYAPGLTNLSWISLHMGVCNPKTKILIFVTMSESSYFALQIKASQNRMNINYFLKYTGIQQFLPHFCKAVSCTIMCRTGNIMFQHTWTPIVYYTIKQIRCNTYTLTLCLATYPVMSCYKKTNPLMIMKNCCISLLWNQLLLFKG